MANGDNLADLIAVARRELSDVPPEVWDKFAALAAQIAGGSRIYVAAAKKRRHLEAIAAADADASAAEIARKLGLTDRRVRQLKRLI